MLIRMEQEHIDHGLRGECSSCPVALVLTDYRFTDVAVSGDGFTYGPKQDFVALPEVVNDWINEFDWHGTGSPISFEIDAVPA